VVTASLMIHHGFDKLQHVEGFSTNVIAAYFPFLPGPPVFWTYLSAGFEIGGSFCITVGLFARPAAALLAGTMVNAVAFQLMKFGLQGWPFGLPPGGPAYTFEPSLAFFAVSVRILAAGAGQFALHSNPVCTTGSKPTTPATLV
jgi:putative oxidoreductase